MISYSSSRFTCKFTLILESANPFGCPASSLVAPGIRGASLLRSPEWPSVEPLTISHNLPGPLTAASPRRSRPFRGWSSFSISRGQRQLDSVAPLNESRNNSAVSVKLKRIKTQGCMSSDFEFYSNSDTSYKCYALSCVIKNSAHSAVFAISRGMIICPL